MELSPQKGNGSGMTVRANSFLAVVVAATASIWLTVTAAQQPGTSGMYTAAQAPGTRPLAAATMVSIGSASGGQSLAAAPGAGAPTAVAPGTAAPAAAQAAAQPELAPRRQTVTGEVRDYPPVTDAMLRDQDPGDWLMMYRDYRSTSHSPLTQITRDNVRQLELKWVWAMTDVGRNQPTPMVHAGTIFLANIGNIVQALDAETGTLIWEHELGGAIGAYGGAQSATRSLGLYQDKVYVATHDARMIALEARTGKVVWETPVADYTQGFNTTGGPLVVNGVVIQGMTGCQTFTEAGCAINAFDAASGKPLWKFHTAARASEPGGETWGELADLFRAGGDPWLTGSYDPDLDLVFWGTAQAKPFLAASRRMTVADTALYTNSTLALRPKDGQLAWHFQHVPGETLDMDEAFERVLVDVDGRKVVFSAGKHGILWKLDRTTGAFLDYKETVFQNIFKNIDETTGVVTYRDDIAQAEIGTQLDVCPSVGGGHSRAAMSYHPGTGFLVIPLHQTCMVFAGREVAFEKGGGGYGGGGTVFHEMPGTGGNIGKLAAFDTKTLEQVWTFEQRPMFTSAALTTGGDLVFIGDVDRNLRALDVKTGEVIWQTRLGTAVQGFPVSFAVGGKQYIAVPTGVGGGAFRRSGLTLAPEIHVPRANGSALYVFGLPDAP